MKNNRLDLYLKPEEKQALRNTARYYGMSMTALFKKWIEYDGPEGFRRELKAKFA